ncbi:hypothetical protein GM658_15430 [Pseudoduganella eburnea]|uniref:Uncharacterized protein n=1 Tax=Massilia eburnea TaxID=1776165 RepID=A0A6L6QK16_9BURK|nr:hypothetical protein [Massilia eburnea]MTW11996.1 hypothetical protein [Massilia eburnea]
MPLNSNPHLIILGLHNVPGVLMLNSEVRSAIFEAVAAKVKPLGYKSHKRDYSFSREFEGGFHCISFGIVDYAPKIIVTPMVSVRLDSLDEIANKFDTTISPDARSRQTAILLLADYFAGRQKKYSISTEEDLTEKTTEILDVLENQMLPFIERCADISFVESLLRSESGPKLHPNPLGLALAIIGAASLCRRQDIAQVGAKARIPLQLRNVSWELPIFDQTLEHILSTQAR